MKQVKLSITYCNNVKRQKISELWVDLSTASWSDIELIIEEKTVHFRRCDFNVKNIFVYMGDRYFSIDSENGIESYIYDGYIRILYSEVIALNNAAHLDKRCPLKNGGYILFDIFPNEGNHRFTPHVLARYQNQTIRIVIAEQPSILEPGHYSGNARKHERTAMDFVSKNLDYFLEKWNEMVEVQYSHN